VEQPNANLLPCPSTYMADNDSVSHQSTIRNTWQ